MSRIRSVHPGLWTDERFVTASPMARLFFLGLWNECDDYGSFEWAPLKLKMRLLPADNADAIGLLSELESAGSVLKYEVAGKQYGAVRNFCQYQRPKKPNSVFPQTDEVRNWVNIEARSSRDGSEAVENQSGTNGEKPRQMKDEGGSKEGSSDELPPRAARPWVLPAGVSLQVWTDLLSNRKRRRLGNTPTAWKSFNDDLARISTLTGIPPPKLIEHAAAKGWGAIYDPREDRNGQQRTDSMGRNQSSDGLSPTSRAARDVFGIGASH